MSRPLINNQVSIISIPGQGYMTYNTYTWTIPSAITLPGGIKRENTYTPIMQLKSLNVKDPAQTALMSYNYDYSPAGNVTAKNTEQGNYAYQYDELYRLINATNASNEAYTYDAVGNRLTSADVQGNWAYNENNELLSYNGVSYEYDSNGNIISKTDQTGTTTFTYDQDNRLVQLITHNSQLITYYYDPFGKRLWKEVNGVRTYFFYSDEGLIGEYGASGNEIKTYGYAPNSTWTANPLFQKIGTNYYWYQNDHLGTPQKIVEGSGRLVWSATYDALGKSQLAVAEIENNLRFPGQYHDQETELYYNYNRYYDPGTGRYVTPDPVGLNGGTNLYVYAGNRPTVESDPLGLWIGWIHREITEMALADAGLKCCKFAAGLPDDVAGVDDEPGFQDPDHSFYHAMVDCYNRAGWALERMKYYDLIKRKWQSCDVKDIRYALHAVQDSYAPAHKGFQPWCGGIHIVKHVTDLFMTNAAYDAANRSRWLLEDIAKCCPQLCR